ncbi:MAG: zf-HC2 domain-containing protein [Lachnospiraceae bacterium]|jgi:hypothetical protein
MSEKTQTVCEQMQRKIPQFVSGTLSDAELKAFLKHVSDCSDCQKELMTYDILEYGLKEKKNMPFSGPDAVRLALDYNFQGFMKKQLRDMETELRRKKYMEEMSELALLITDAIGFLVIFILFMLHR